MRRKRPPDNALGGTTPVKRDSDTPESDVKTSGKAEKQRLKSYTGCWTCRKRKLKCDLGRPVCARCTKSKLACRGYGFQLSWGTDRENRAGRRMPSCLERRAMAAHMNIEYNAIDTVLEYADQVERQWLLHGRAHPLADTFTGPFGLLFLGPQPQSGTHDDIDAFFDSVASVHGTLAAVDATQGLGWQNMEQQLTAMAQQEDADLVPGAIGEQELINNVIKAFEDDSRAIRIALADAAGPLMQYYRHYVARWMPPVRMRANPWLEIHLRRALLTSTENTEGRIVSYARSATICALLAVTAFQLYNRYPSQFTERLTLVGYHAQNLAFGALKNAIESFQEQANVDLLAAILCLSTVEVTLGTVAYCENHLLGLNSILSRIDAHRQDDPEALATQCLTQMARFFALMFETGRARLDPLEYTRAEAATLPPFVPGQPQELDNDRFGLQYGVHPATSLAIELSHRYARYLKYYEEAGESLPEELRERVDALERGLVEWTAQAPLELYENATEQQIGLEHMTAFHLGALIFFKVYVRNENPRSAPIQELSLYVLWHMETIERMNTEQGLYTTPVIWPAFFASVVASDQEARQPWDAWWARIARCGFKYIAFAKSVVQATRFRPDDCDWRQVVTEMDMPAVMLS